MRQILFWMLNAPEGIAIEDWDSYLDQLAVSEMVIVGVTALGIVVLYGWWAHRLRLIASGDVFAFYKPILSLFGCLIGGLAAAWVVVDSYEGSVFQAAGMLQTALNAAFFAIAVSFLLSLVLIMAIPQLTPPLYLAKRDNAVMFWRGR